MDSDFVAGKMDCNLYPRQEVDMTESVVGVRWDMPDYNSAFGTEDKRFASKALSPKPKQLLLLKRLHHFQRSEQGL